MKDKKTSEEKIKPINSVRRRLVIMAVTSLVILLTAGSCSIPGFSPGVTDTLGVLKIREPGSINGGFARINNVQTLSGDIVANGIGNLSGLKLLQVDTNTYYFLSRDKGLLLTENEGQFWSRRYIFEVSDPSTTDEDTITSQIRVNDSFISSDIALDPNDDQTIYYSGVFNKLGKIYVSSDRGQTFREIYSEVEENIGVNFLAVDPADSSVYALLEEGALITSRDGGRTWQKLRDFEDTPVQMGFVEEFSGLFYILFEDEGLFTSTDGGENWTQQPTVKSESVIGEKQPADGLDGSFTESESFGKFEKIVPVTASRDGGWLMIADRQLWYSTSLTAPYEKLVLPLQNEQFNILDLEPDPILGLDRLYVSIDNKLFLTENRGTSWTTGDLIKLSTPIGQIGDIHIDTENPDKIYLMLVQDGSSRGGIFG